VSPRATLDVVAKEEKSPPHPCRKLNLSCAAHSLMTELPWHRNYIYAYIPHVAVNSTSDKDRQ